MTVTTNDDLGMAAPTPQDWGFPEKPTIQQRGCWENQQRFLRRYAERGKKSLAAADVGIHPTAVERWQSVDLYGFNKRFELAYQAYREMKEEENQEWVRESNHNTQIYRIFEMKAIWREKYGDNVTITAETPVKAMLEQMRQIGLAQQRALEQGAAEGEFRDLEEKDEN
jgi:hypothetical protein